MTYHYIYKEVDKNHPSFLLLHGTGGSEEDLLQFAKLLEPSYNVIAVRGDVNESGARRFFKRHSHGEYDLDDLNLRGKNLYHFTEKLVASKDLDIETVIPTGFSNGANIAINMLLRAESRFKKAILMAPMYPVDLDEGPDLTDLDLFLSMGKEDPIVSPLDNQYLLDMFNERGAKITCHWTQGHQITRSTLDAAQAFLEKN